MIHCATSAVLVVHTDNGDGFDKDEKNSNSQESKVDDYYFCDARRHLHEVSKLVIMERIGDSETTGISVLDSKAPMDHDVCLRTPERGAAVQ